MRTLCTVLLLFTLSLTACSERRTLDIDALAGQARGGDAAACRQLVELLGVAENGVNDRVYPLLVELGPAMAPYLLEQVNNSDRVRREHVIAALGSLKVSGAVAPIGAILTEAKLERRYIAAWALGEIADPAGLPFLLAALDDSDAEVRKYATRSLIKLNRTAVPALLAYLPGAPERGAAGAIRALGDIGDPAALSALLAQATGPNRLDVFLALGKLKEPRAQAVLVAGLSDGDWRVRMNAAMALGPVGGPEAVAPLRRTLNDPEHVVREWSARSLEVITGSHVQYRNEKGEMVSPYSIYH